MDLFDTLITPAWIQVGELGLAFVVILLCSGLVLYVMKTSSKREAELMAIIIRVLPVMESMSTSMTNINLRLESIEDNMGITVKVPRKRSETVPRKVKKEVVDGA